MIGRTVGNYVIESQLGRGSMGIVYLARHIKVRRFAAVKVLLQDQTHNLQLRERLLAEYRILDSIHHGNIVGLYDVCVEDNQVFLVQEYLAGRTLRAMLDEGSMGLLQVTILAQQILSGLAHIHSLGILHRDIKPANIMLTVRKIAELKGVSVEKVVDQVIANTERALGIRVRE